ncbi:hypothetical protein Caci_3889 [Catenulispora acidiphila DSM 44928]|uniref:Uncharacterized protein n=1 Tax=Catenulispora acidiphila (strain DSM 44928 / JCM 14897 / NBRC 102108 / NRRL B-24433 / ID139908) TaxID=479433 RepID=C7QDI4_CATAD|nr:hypothetical protein [Catenulispora acidiphila]ACU72777.1 hypothetical protein Caci_3889 [Catenulispora acidiphila DSM 44928]
MAKRQSSNSVEHPWPTDATAKQLYGTAFRCAEPDCREPLYRKNSATGQTLLNSRIAHICARSENGPRWDAAMTEDDNRSADNLLLLCQKHASEIDDTPDDFPVPLLRGWKRAQLAEHERCRQGWEISDEQAAEVTRLSFTLEQLVDAITDLMPFSPRQRSRTEALDLADARLHAGRRERLSMVASDRVEDVLRWTAALPDPAVEVPLGQLRVLVAPMGAGKTEQAARWFEAALQDARDDDAVAVPVWLEAREAVNGLEDAVRSRLGQDPKAVCCVVVNDLERIDPVDADRLLSEARQMVGVWPMVAILATAQPGVTADHTVCMEVEAWAIERGAELMRVASGTDMPWRLWSPETTELVRRPLTALALAGRLVAGGDTGVSRLQLLRDLPRTIVQSRRPRDASPQVWQALERLAIRILQEHGPVPAEAIGNESEVWQLTDTRLVVEHDGVLSFALPAFEQYFGAHAITSGTFDIESAASRASFPFWRYAIAFAIATRPDSAQREQLLCRVARTNPAALSWVLNEIKPNQSHHPVTTRTQDTLPASAPTAANPDSDNAEADPAIASASWLREAFEALLEGYGPFAASLAPHHEGRLLQWGAHLNAGYLTVSEHWENTTPAVVSLPDFSHLRELRPGGWRSSRMFPEPAGDYSRWQWARDRILATLTDAIQRRTLATSVGTHLTHERLWVLADFAMSTAGTRLQRDAIALGDLRQAVAAMMETVNTSVSATWQHIGHTVSSADIIWLNEQLAHQEGEALLRPWPPSDLVGTPRMRWQGYSPDTAVSMTAEILAEAVAGYRDLVETNLPAFGPALGLYSLLPARVEGTITYSEAPGEYPPRLNFAWIPDPALDPRAPTPVELRTENEPGRRPYWHTPKGPRPASRTAYHIPMLEDGITPLGNTRPSTNLAYEWLARDLHALGWLKDPTTFHE